MSDKRLAGKVALVTGASRGIGAAIARRLAADGAAVAVNYTTSAAAAEQVVADIRKAGGTAVAVRADLGDPAAIPGLFADVNKAFGRLDILVNAAGLTDRGSIWDTSPELFDRMMAVNVRAPFFLMQECAKIMQREKIAGTMVNILSMSAHGGQPFITAYCSSKGALLTLTKNIAFSLLRQRIRVNGLNIGWMDTPGEDRIMRTYHDAQDGWRDAAEATLPLGRLVKVDEVARAVAYLSSEESGLMTGSIIDFDQSVVGCYEAAPQPSV